MNHSDSSMQKLESRYERTTPETRNFIEHKNLLLLLSLEFCLQQTGMARVEVCLVLVLIGTHAVRLVFPKGDSQHI